MLRTSLLRSTLLQRAHPRTPSVPLRAPSFHHFLSTDTATAPIRQVLVKPRHLAAVVGVIFAVGWWACNQLRKTIETAFKANSVERKAQYLDIMAALASLGSDHRATKAVVDERNRFVTQAQVDNIYRVLVREEGEKEEKGSAAP
ncbi:hypothetical protein JCM10449v2_000766 [Rhodotorula kratochvilovae]